MFLPILVLLSALSISVIAAYYSIIGLTTIFSGAVVAVAIMGSALEIGKVITATWLHHNWSVIPWLMKAYLTFAVLILMFITSMGIFGYLSKSHITQGAPMSVVQTKIEQIDFTIKQEQENIVQEQKNITSSQRVLDQLDKSMELYFEKGIIRRALREREKQQEERKQVQQQIVTANENIKKTNITIAELTSNKFQLSQQVKNFEVEVGPIKYIAELVYGKTNTAILDKAVRWIILTLIFVFDPLAILLILAANISFKQYKDNKKLIVSEPIKIQDPETNNTNPKQVLNKHIEQQLNNKDIEEPKHFTSEPKYKEEEVETINLDAMVKDREERENNVKEIFPDYFNDAPTSNNNNKPDRVFDNWEDEVEQDELYVDIPPKTSSTIKVKMKNKITLEDTEVDENFVKYGGSFVPIRREKDILSNSLIPQDRETKLAIPEKIAEQHKIAHQEALNMPVNIIYKPVMPSKAQLNTTIQNVFNKASISPQMPYNLESESGEFLKKLLVEELERQFQNAEEAKKPSNS